MRHLTINQCLPRIYGRAPKNQRVVDFVPYVHFVKTTIDNLSSHKVSGIAQIIEAAGAQVKFLPPYSPDFNPIELMWSKIKTILRKLKIRSK